MTDWPTIIADGWSALDADAWAILPLDYVSSSSSSSSSDEQPEMPSMFSNPIYNMPPIVTINGKSPGRTTKIDQMTTKFTNVQTLKGPVWINMVSPYANSVIRYETNGKNPYHFSKFYTGPLCFYKNGSGSDRTVIKARIYDITNVNIHGRIIRLEFNVI